MKKESFKENKTESIREAFINEVGASVLDTYPFGNPEEKNIFVEKINKLTDTLPINDNETTKELKKILAILKNTHLSLREETIAPPFTLNRNIYYKAGEFWINENNQPLRIIGIDNKPIMDRVSEQLEFIGGGTKDWKINKALQAIRDSKEQVSISIAVDNKGTQQTIDASFLPFNQSKDIIKEKFVRSEIIEGNLGYLKINSWSNKIIIDNKNIADFVKEELHNLEKTDGIIIDVRDNSGGDSSLAAQLAGRFVDKPMVYTNALIRKEKSNTLEKEDFKIKPISPKINKPVVVLTGPKCLSSNELFILMLKDGGHVITIGETTGGGSGCPKSFSLHLGEKKYTLNVPTWKLIRNNGQELENKGIEPDIEVKATIQDVIEKKDPILQRAIDYLKKC